jgi:deoxyadenosine/deoxycytidine kinase
MYTILTSQVPKPDVVVHLNAPLDVLLGRISQRGRPYEQNMDAEYLDRLRALYQQFFQHYEDTPLLEIDTTDIDFSRDDQAVEDLLKAATETWRRAREPQAVSF